MTKVAINGLGRIGRSALKILLQYPELQLVAVNDIAPADNLAYLLNFDTVYGKADNRVWSDPDNLYLNGKRIPLFSKKNPSELPWRDLDVDIVLECTGKFTTREDLQKHIDAGAKRVILSAPAKSNDVITVVPGVNRPENEPMEIISTASCTTNCITPIMEILGRRIGVKKAVMTTIHAYTASQSLVDEPNKNWRRGRSAANNLVPTSTGAAVATTKVLPELQGKFDGIAIRGPIPVGSIADITLVTDRPTSVEEINRIFSEEAGSERYVGILGVNVEPIVSSDIIKDPRASLVDLTMTQVIDGDLVKIMSWYDNEWGYANQMIREAKRLSLLVAEEAQMIQM